MKNSRENAIMTKSLQNNVLDSIDRFWYRLYPKRYPWRSVIKTRETSSQKGNDRSPESHSVKSQKSFD